MISARSKLTSVKFDASACGSCPLAELPRRGTEQRPSNTGQSAAVATDLATQVHIWF